MEFHSHPTMYSNDKEDGRVKRGHHVEEYYQETMANIKKAMSLNTQMQHLMNYCVTELRWYRSCRPYFKVWPSIVDALAKIKLDTGPESLFESLIPITVAMRFAKGHEPIAGGRRLHTVLVSYITQSTVGGHSTPTISIEPGGVVIATGEYRECSPICFWARDGMTVEEQLDRIRKGGTAEFTEAQEYFQLAAKIGLAVLMLATDQSIIRPDVLAADRESFKRTGDSKYIERAKKRGVVGWSIGEEYESCPHFRRPHFALRHTGKGGTIPKIVPVKAAVVHRDKMTRVPTGYITPDGVEVES